MDRVQGQPVQAVDKGVMTTLMGQLIAAREWRHTRLTSLAVGVMLSLVACKVDPDLPPVPPVEPPDNDCPIVEPIAGPFAMKGACCYRASNRERLEQSHDGKAVLEFRVMASQVVSQLRTVGSAAFVGFVQRGYDMNRSVSLIRIHDFPTNPPGEVVIETGPGRFNADGTYSFLDGAAPVTENHTDRDRWNSVTTRAYYDPDAPEGERFVPLDDEVATALLVTPEWRMDGTLDYELPQYQPSVRSMTIDEDLNCIGERGDATRWISYDELESFVPVDQASATMLSTGWSLCTSMAFGFLALGSSTCESSPRSMWVELPTAMCNDGDCYVGDVLDERADCKLDPSATADERPVCCDPLDASDTLPGCNAFHVRASYVAAAVEITDDPVNDATPIQSTLP